ncbi:MAG: hypothetical protein ACYDCC_00875 [Actinomycetota bacterium]
MRRLRSSLALLTAITMMSGLLAPSPAVAGPICEFYMGTTTCEDVNPLAFTQQPQGYVACEVEIYGSHLGNYEDVCIVPATNVSSDSDEVWLLVIANVNNRSALLIHDTYLDQKNGFVNPAFDCASVDLYFPEIAAGSCTSTLIDPNQPGIPGGADQIIAVDVLGNCYSVEIFADGYEGPNVIPSTGC